MLAFLLACAQGRADPSGPDDEDVDETDACEAIEQYVDADADGYGGGEVGRACAGAPGFSPVTGDCDDADAGVSPGADERCAEGDENCDGAEGEGAIDAATWYADVDEDGFGEDASAIVACDAPAGTVQEGGDCDDGDEEVNPDAFDACGDGADADCDGQVDETCADVRAISDGDDRFGWAVCGGADLTGDGIADFAVSDPAAGPGTAYVFSGAASGDLTVEDAVATISGPADADWAGFALRCGADVTADGVGDLVLQSEGGGYSEEFWPASWIVEGPFSGEFDVTRAWGSIGAGSGGYLVQVGSQAASHLFLWRFYYSDDLPRTYVRTETVPGRIAADDLPAIIEESAGSGFPSAVARCDTDGDGDAEVIYGQGGLDVTATFEGGAYRVTAPLTADLALADADARVVGTRAGDSFGWAVECLGDANGDGADDVAVGGGQSSATVDYGGRVWVFSGDGLAADGEADARASLLIDGSVGGELAGEELGVAADGTLVVGAYGTATLYGVDPRETGAITLSDGSALAKGNEPFGGFGEDFAVWGDGDIVVGALWDLAWDGTYGTAYVFRAED